MGKIHECPNCHEKWSTEKESKELCDKFDAECKEIGV